MSDLYRPTDTCTDMEHAVQMWVVPVEPDDVMNAAHKLVHPMYDNAADCDKFWCEPFRALKKEIGDTEPLHMDPNLPNSRHCPCDECQGIGGDE